MIQIFLCKDENNDVIMCKIDCLFRCIICMVSLKQISTKYTEISTKYLGDLY